MNIVFDLDGTVIDSAPDLRNAVNVVLRAAGRRPITLDETHRFVGQGSRVLVERAFAATGDPAHDLDAATARYLEAYRSATTLETVLYAGVQEALTAAQAAGWGLALCTNKPEGPTHEVLATFDLAGFFGEAVVGGDTLPVRKPDPAPVHEALARLGVPNGPAVFVGDSETDVAAARAAELPVIAVAWGYRRHPVEALGADAVLEDYSALVDTVRRVSRTTRSRR